MPTMLPDDAYNQALVNNVHPPDWVNPTPKPRYNLVVIGAGTAGLVTAAGAAGLGAHVALIEKHFMGGDCLNVGCVPSKGLIRASRAWASVRNAGEFGVQIPDGVRYDFGAAMERMRRIRTQISSVDSAARFQSLGVDVFLGTGRFTGSDSIEVDGKTLSFKRAVIATGARAAALPIPGLAETGYLTNETVFSITELPKRLAVIGAGAIGCEMAQAFARFGSTVTVFEKECRILPRDDYDGAEIVKASISRDGVHFTCNANILKIESHGSEKVIHCETAGKTTELVVDEILMSIGRAPNVEDMNLDAVGVSYNPQVGVTVDERLQTTNPRIFAAGDICFPYKFTHSADAMARIVIANTLFHGRQKTSALTIPWCTYTEPEIAHVGLRAEDAQAKGYKINTFTWNLEENDRAILDGETEGFARLHVQEGTDKILGATIVAAHAGDMISEITLAMTNGLGLSAIAKTIHPYPTQAEAIKRLGDAYNKTRLTPRVKSIFNRWLTWTR
ncbi:MAG TPA: mercuric reductase [Nitrospirales bacterium]|nr:mercuric reductase [Nitrospirales bacterium]